MIDTTTLPGGWPRSARISSVVLAAIAASPAAARQTVGRGDGPARPSLEHVDQLELLRLVAGGRGGDAFLEAFEEGDELFETRFRSADGVGASVGGGQRFTRVPRADLVGPGEWANHVPARATGPNAESCNACHIDPSDDGSGGAVANVHRDPRHTGLPQGFLQRNTPHLFGAGGIQRLAEEMTARLHELRSLARARACATGQPVVVELIVQGISFGELGVIPTGASPCDVTLDTSRVVGIDADLVVRPFQWKGSVAFLRDFNRDAAHNEIGMQAVEIAGDAVDGDGDGVADELGVGDLTALSVYLSAQPRPTNELELDRLGLLEPPLAAADRASILRGRREFLDAACVTCHRPRLRIVDPEFQEPSADASYRDAVFPAGQDPVASGVDPAFPISFDLTEDLPDNRLVGPGGTTVALGTFERDDDGRAIVRLFGDLKRHDLGPGLAEPFDEVGTGASTFLTENLWGVGSTAPYLHDGRATTLEEAILAHGGEAVVSRDRYAALPPERRADLERFLQSLVLFKLAPD